MADKKTEKYHFLTGDVKTMFTKEFESDADAIKAGKENEAVIRVQHNDSTKYIYERANEPAKPAEKTETKTPPPAK